MPATSSAPGSQPQAVSSRKARRRKPQTAPLPSAVARSEVPKAVEQAVEIAERAEKKARKRAKRAQQARRDAAYARRLERLADRQETAAAQAAKKAKRAVKKSVERGEADPTPKSIGDTVDEIGRRVVARGVLTETGLVSKKTAGDVREGLTGSRNPSALELAIAAAPIPAAKGLTAVRAVVRGERALKTASRAQKAKGVIRAGKTVRKAERKGLRAAESSRLAKARATGKGLGKQARKRLSKAETKAAARRTAHRTADRTLKAATSPVIGAAAVAPGKVGEQVRENLEATFVPGKAANPLKTAQTTVKALPGLFTAGASVAGAAVKSAKTGDPDYLTGTLKALGEGSKELLRPLVEGDSEEIARAMEEDIGYPLAPLLPRGAVSKPGKAAAKVVTAPVRVPAKAAIKRATRAKKAREVKRGNIPTEPGRLRGMRQRATGGKVRRDVSGTVTRPREEGARRGVREAREITDQKFGRVSKREEAVSAAAVLARYGIGRKNTLERLDDAVRGTRDEGNVVNDREVAAWLHANKEVLSDEGFWDTVAEWHAKQDPKVTSKRAQFMAQADIAGVETPKSPKMLRKEARYFSRKAARATGRDAEIYRRAAKRRRDHAQRITDYWKAKGVGPRRSAERFHPDEVDQMVERTRAKRNPDLEDPIWLSEPAPKVEPQSGRASKYGLKQHASTGATRRAGKADRSLPALLEGSVIIPNVRKGIARGVRQVIQKYRLAVDGRNAFKGQELLDMHEKGIIDLREHVAVPARDWEQAMNSEAFDLKSYYGDEIAPALRGEVDYLRNRKGSNYVLLPREAARELDYQLNPREGGPVEQTLRTTSGIASRIVLFSPAWAAAQVINESSQLIADAGVLRTSKAAGRLIKFRYAEPELYRDILDVSGSGAPVAQPFGHKTSMSKGDYISTNRAIRGMRRYPPTRAMLEFFNTFSNFDRWKTTRLRAVALLAKNDKEFGQFTRGLGGMIRSMDDISKRLSKMSATERDKFLLSPEGRKLLEGNLTHVDDMLGNWEAFTRYERSFGPLLAFYPYLRMSLRWTFRTYPQKHPVKAQILYLLSQQNREQLEKLTGHDPDMLESAFPALYDQEGNVEGVLPGGARFGAPGSNVIAEAVGDANLAGLSRLLNPAISTTLGAFYGVSPFTGKQVEGGIGSTEWAINGAELLLSTPPPFRALGLNTIGEKSDAAKAFEDIDPERAIRSAVNPFMGMSADAFRDQTILAKALETVSNKPEYGDLVDAFMAKDKARVKELAKQIDLAKDAQKILEKYLPKQPGEKRAVSKAGSVYYEGSKGLRGGSSTSSSGGAYASTFGGGGGGSGAYAEVFGGK